MAQDEKKLTRLIAVLKMYYEQELSQQEIAQKIGVSRPMVSKMLAEGKRLNLVTITINEVQNMQQVLALRMAEHFALQQVIVVKTEKCKETEIQAALAHECYGIVKALALPYYRVGVGCGSVIGQFSDIAAQQKPLEKPYKGEVFPLFGGLRASYKSYHANELVRTFAEFSGLKATYMYLPALVDSPEEKELFRQTELYADLHERWAKANVALVNISNLYDAPDLATSVRFGSRLREQHAVGRFLAHYYDIDGKMITPERDNVMQTELPELKKIDCVIGVCASKVNKASLVGALRTGIFTHVIITDVLANSIIESLGE